MSLAELKGSSNTIALSGELKFATVPSLRQQFAKSIENLSSSPNIVVNLAAVSQCDSSGVALLLEFVRLSKAAQKTIRFINIPAQLQALMHATALTEILETA